jgi:NTE family protein
MADRLLGRWNLDRSPGYLWFNLLGQLFSPCQTNPLDHHPLRGILAGQIDMEAVRACRALRVSITATNVRTGRPRVFGQDDLSLDALLASACLPHLFQAVEIDGDPYWDGGYMGNPAIWPLIYGCQTADVVLVQINALVREDVPRTSLEINNRMNEIAFNASLMHEMRAVAFVQRLLARAGDQAVRRATLTILPQRRSRIPGTAALVAWKAAERLMPRTASHLSSGNSSTRATCWMPALLTRTSTAPSSSVAC